VDESADTRPLSSSSSWQPSTMEVLAGSGNEGFADGAGAAAQFNEPIGVSVDGEGNIIIADFSNHCVRKITPEGTVSTIAGSGNEGFADGTGASAQFNCPYGVAVDGGGNVIVTDLGNHRVRKITPDGNVSTLAGSGREGFADGAGAAAEFDSPYGVAVDGEGSIIIANCGNHRVCKITPDGTVSTLAGSGSAGFADGAGATAQFNLPDGCCRGWQGQHHHNGVQKPATAQDHSRRHREHALSLAAVVFEELQSTPTVALLFALRRTSWRRSRAALWRHRALGRGRGVPRRSIMLALPSRLSGRRVFSVFAFRVRAVDRERVSAFRLYSSAYVASAYVSRCQHASLDILAV
jgi:hypothetical protein